MSWALLLWGSWGQIFATYMYLSSFLYLGMSPYCLLVISGLCGVLIILNVFVCRFRYATCIIQETWKTFTWRLRTLWTPGHQSWLEMVGLPAVLLLLVFWSWISAGTREQQGWRALFNQPLSLENVFSNCFVNSLSLQFSIDMGSCFCLPNFLCLIMVLIF